MFRVNSLTGFGFGERGPKVTYVGAYQKPGGTTSNSWTYAGCNLGPATPKLVVVAIMGNDSGGGTAGYFVSGSIGGVAGDKINDSPNDKWATGMMQLETTAATGDIIITMSGSYSRGSIAIFYITGYRSVLPYSTTEGFADPTTALNISTNIPDRGVVIMNGHTNEPGFSWNYGTQNFNAAPEGNYYHIVNSIDNTQFQNSKTLTLSGPQTVVAATVNAWR